MWKEFLHDFCPFTLLTEAARYRAIVVADMLADGGGDLNFTQAMALRASGKYANGSDRLLLAYPRATAVLDGQERATYFSPIVAAAISVSDARNGFWFSPGNSVINGITGISVPLSASFFDNTTDVQQLNRAGIFTIFPRLGGGFLVWGNRSAAFNNGEGAVSSFVSVRRTADALLDSVQRAVVQFLSKPITPGWIDTVLETVNSYMRSLESRGALLSGSGCFYDKAKNPASELAQGKIIFDLVFMPPVSAERIVIESFIDIQLLNGVSA